MLFNSLEFLIFFPVVTAVYFLLPHRWRWLHLLIASCVFYAAFIPVYILILLLTIVIDYTAGIMIENAVGHRRKLFLILSIVTNVGILAYFKYYNFFADNINAVLASAGFTIHTLPLSHWILPIGLSFHTFQAMSYTIEVYRGNQRAERHAGIYALYVMFYPQLVAGPIERPQNLLHQFHEKKQFDYENLFAGLRQILWGMFKKVVIADRLGLLVGEVYNHPSLYYGATWIVATIFFAIEIYCDFSGYSSIAIGCARVMGFKLMQNFDTPYQATSIRAFWQRWHISLSTWFKDYVYFPLGGSRTGKYRWYYNLFITFLISGVWHGANWTFVIWGSLHGCYMIAGAMMSTRLRPLALTAKVPAWLIKPAQQLFVFVLVCFAWIFFRANSLADASLIIQRMADVGHYKLSQVGLSMIPEKRYTVYTIDVLLSWLWIAFLILAETRRVTNWFQQTSRPVRWSFYILAVIVLIVFGVYDNKEFIYFQF